MSSPSFPQFTRLPAELRLQIWRMALRPTSPRSLHYVSLRPRWEDISQRWGPTRRSQRIKEQGPKPIPKNLKEIRLPVDTTDARYPILWATKACQSYAITDNSAFWWDHGLWTACYESKVIVENHYRISESFAKNEEYSRLRKEGGGESFDPNEEQMKIMVPLELACARPPLLLNTKESQLSIHSEHDLFCLDLQNWRACIDWTALDYPLRFPTTPEGVYDERFHHFALEFDASWNADLPSSLTALMEEDSPRGFVATALAESASRFFDIKIYLIDRETSLQSQRVSTPLYPHSYDSQTRYFEMMYSAGWDKIEDNVSEAAFFIGHLDWIGRYELDEIAKERFGPSYVFRVEDKVRILLCEDSAS